MSGPVAVDATVNLGSPFSIDEYASIEGILGWLWEAASSDGLTGAQQFQILAIAQLIEHELQETVPEETKREVMVRLIQRGLKWVVQEIPKNALALVKLGEILNDAGWFDTAAQLF